MVFEGGCACGAVRFRVKGSPFRCVQCHCASCRSATGAPLSGLVCVARAQVTWDGVRSFQKSSPGVTRGFCGQCGTHLHVMSTRWPGEIHLIVATLGDGGIFQPTAHQHWAARVQECEVNDDLPRYEGRAP